MPAVETAKIRSVTSNVLDVLRNASGPLTISEIRNRLQGATASDVRQALIRLLDSQEAKLTKDNEKIEAKRENIRRRQELRDSASR